MQNITENKSKQAKVIDFNQFKKKRSTPSRPEPKTPGLPVEPFKMPAKDPKSKGSDPAWNFNERLSKIRGSLDRIHNLMSELRGLSADSGTKKKPKK